MKHLFLSLIMIMTVSMPVFAKKSVRTVWIKSTPSNAKVYLKKSGKYRYIGTTPKKVRLYGGNRRIIVKKAGYSSYKLQFDPRVQTRYYIQLHERLILRRAQITSDPVGSTVYIKREGKYRYIGSTPMWGNFITGDRDVLVMKPGYKTKRFYFDPDRVRKYHITLNPSDNYAKAIGTKKSVIQISSKPLGAKIYLKTGDEYKYIGSTPLQGRITLGEKKIMIKKNGYKSFMGTLNVTGSRKYTINLKSSDGNGDGELLDDEKALDDTKTKKTTTGFTGSDTENARKIATLEKELAEKEKALAEKEKQIAEMKAEKSAELSEKETDLAKKEVVKDKELDDDEISDDADSDDDSDDDDDDTEDSDDDADIDIDGEE